MTMGRPFDRAALRAMFAAPAAYAVDKVMPLEAALRAHVAPGMTIHLAYSEGRPMAASNALVRCFGGTNPGFTIVGSGLVSNQGAFVTEGLLKRIEVSFVGENYPTPAPNRIFQDAINSGAIEIENQSLLALYQRLAAGAFGFPFALTRSWIGSSLERNPSFATVTDPFGSGETVGALKALIPDVTIVHGLAADPQGNILLSPPFGEGEIAAFAARRGVIATVERIVSPDVIRSHPTLAKIPAHRVLSVSETPLGCHPYAIYDPAGLGIGAYVEDYDFFKAIRAASRSTDTFKRWVAEWILGVEDHDGYLRKLGADRIAALRGRAAEEAWQDDLDPAAVAQATRPEGADATERMVVAAAHVLEEKVRAAGYGIVEAGVGFANLAAWLAVSRLQMEGGIPAELVAEIGLYGYMPKAGEPFIFSNRNLPSCKSLTGVEAILGLHVGGRHNDCIGIIGAGQIDAEGNINSTYGSDGRFLVGSGGANDITVGAREVIAVTQQSKQRLVESLPYVTSPGARVSTLVTDLGVYEKREGRFVLTRHFGDDREAAVALARAQSGWAFEVADGLSPAAVPSADELTRLRLYDPRCDFLTPPKSRGPSS